MGYEENQKQEFRQEMDKVMRGISKIDDIIIGVTIKIYIDSRITDNKRVREG